MLLFEDSGRAYATYLNRCCLPVSHLFSCSPFCFPLPSITSTQIRSNQSLLLVYITSASKPVFSPDPKFCDLPLIPLWHDLLERLSYKGASSFTSIRLSIRSLTVMRRAWSVRGTVVDMANLCCIALASELIPTYFAFIKWLNMKRICRHLFDFLRGGHQQSLVRPLMSCPVHRFRPL